MHSVNPDLLRATARHHADGRPKDPHAHHRVDHLAQMQAERWQRWLGFGSWLTRSWRRLPRTKPSRDCT